MSSPSVPRNAYTDSPEQHPNLILGSWQLLFWIFFRPSAWRIHLTRIDPALHPNSNRWKHLQWRNWNLWKFLIQGYLILPLSTNLLIKLMSLGFSEPREDFIVRTIISMAISLVFGLSLSIVVRVAVGIVTTWTLSIAFSLAFNLTIIITSLVLLVVGIALLIEQPDEMNFTKIIYVFLKLKLIIKPLIKLGRIILIRPLQKILNNSLYKLDEINDNTLVKDDKCSLLRYHSAFWDEWENRQLKGLDKHLILVIERNPTEGRAAIQYLSTSSQRWAAQAALLEMDTRKIEGCVDLDNIRHLHIDLATGEFEVENLVATLIRSFSHISEDVDAALNQVTTYNKRLTLKTVANKLDELSRQLITSNDPYATRLQPVPLRWSKIITDYSDELAKAAELRQEIDSPYIIGNPLTEQQEIFVGRNDISTRIEQLLLDQRRPPLLLYGQRRMGKTSLLNNLGRLLPNTIVPMFVDLQGPVSGASDYTGFLYNIARGMVESAKRKRGLVLPSLTRESIAADSFTCFDEWLDKVEQTLGNNTALLELDEFEELDSAIAKERFDEQDVLGMLRHIIQHRPRFKVLLAGSHTLEEYQRWASYLINVQVVNISYLQEDEARQLIEKPVKNFPLHYEPDAVDRVIEITRCHPCLVQLLCSEIVALKNEQPPANRRLTTWRDVEKAVQEALRSGSLLFADIERNQVNKADLELLKFLAAKGEGATVSKKVLSRQFPDNLNSTLNLLVRRDLLEEDGDGYRFQVELIRRWFARK
ncbi:nSTAND1 domain-containing NTPase [Coleofasciculus chthonoplastes]|uniref:nSTAND1 domain-containing NTPase n=1 Tax=Coleofasciculus chthonoplastes TaxID=64178 RepID=UPI003300154E